MSRAIRLPAELLPRYAVNIHSYHGVRPQLYPNFIDSFLSPRYDSVAQVSKAFERVALAALLITRRPTGFIGTTKFEKDPAADEILKSSSLLMPVPLLWGDWMLKKTGCWQHVRKLRLVLREGPLIELDALLDGACEVVSRCELLCRITVFVRVHGRAGSEESVEYERLSNAKLGKFVRDLGRKNKRVIKMAVLHTFHD